MTGSTSAERLVAYLLGEADELSEADVRGALDAEQLPRLLDIVAAKRETGEAEDAEEVWKLIAFLAGSGSGVTDEADTADAHLICAVYDLLRLEDAPSAAGSFADVSHWLGGCAQADALDQELALDEAVSAFADPARIEQDLKDWLAQWSRYGITPVTWWRAKRAIELEVQRRLRGSASQRAHLLLYHAEAHSPEGIVAVTDDEIIEEVRLSARCSGDVARACCHWICALAQRRALLLDGLRVLDTSASGLLLEHDAAAEPDNLADRLLVRLARQRQRWREYRQEVVEPICPANTPHVFLARTVNLLDHREGDLAELASEAAERAIDALKRDPAFLFEPSALRLSAVLLDGLISGWLPADRLPLYLPLIALSGREASESIDRGELVSAFADLGHIAFAELQNGRGSLPTLEKIHALISEGAVRMPFCALLDLLLSFALRIPEMRPLVDLWLFGTGWLKVQFPDTRIVIYNTYGSSTAGTDVAITAAEVVPTETLLATHLKLREPRERVRSTETRARSFEEFTTMVAVG